MLTGDCKRSASRFSSDVLYCVSFGSSGMSICTSIYTCALCGMDNGLSLPAMSTVLRLVRLPLLISVLVPMLWAHGDDDVDSDLDGDLQGAVVQPFR